MPYNPATYTGDLSSESIMEYVRREFEAIARESNETTALDLRPIHAPPKRPREGMIVFADGTDWNPGGGKGVYTFLSGAWVKL